MATGNEKEELLKGMEVLERTRQWFNDRLALQKSSGKKVRRIKTAKVSSEIEHTHGTFLLQYRAEDLLAIMEGTGRASSKDGITLYHIQQINQHLSRLAMSAPAVAATQQQRQGQDSRGSSSHHKTQRLLSDPGRVQVEYKSCNQSPTVESW